MSNRFPTLLEDGTLIIRASSTPGTPDCTRRTVARAFPELVESKGYKLREIEPHVGAAVGIGVHASAQYILKTKVDQGKLGNLTDATERGIQAMRSEIAAGAQYDKVSANPNQAERQIGKMVRSYRYGIAPHINPVRVERRLTASLMPGYQISGQADALTIEPDSVRDLKTGAHRWPNHAQLGCYSLLARTWEPSGFGGRLYEDYIARVPINTVQPDPKTTEYDRDLCEQIAHRRIDRLMLELEEFKLTSDPLAFQANPQSMLCQDRFCPAWGSEFCREHEGAKS